MIMTAARVLLGKNGLMSYDCGEPLNSQGGLYTLDNHFIKYVHCTYISFLEVNICV